MAGVVVVVAVAVPVLAVLVLVVLVLVVCGAVGVVGGLGGGGKVKVMLFVAFFDDVIGVGSRRAFLKLAWLLLCFVGGVFSFYPSVFGLVCPPMSYLCFVFFVFCLAVGLVLG